MNILDPLQQMYLLYSFCSLDVDDWTFCYPKFKLLQATSELYNFTDHDRETASATDLFFFHTDLGSVCVLEI